MKRKRKQRPVERTNNKVCRKEGANECPLCKKPMDYEWAVPTIKTVVFICSECYKPFYQRRKAMNK